MSQGVGAYIRGVGKAVEDKLTPATRKHVGEVLLPLLMAEYRTAHGPGVQPVFEFDMDLDGQSLLSSSLRGCCWLSVTDVQLVVLL